MICEFLTILICCLKIFSMSKTMDVFQWYRSFRLRYQGSCSRESSDFQPENAHGMALPHDYEYQYNRLIEESSLSLHVYNFNPFVYPSQSLFFAYPPDDIKHVWSA